MKKYLLLTLILASNCSLISCTQGFSQNSILPPAKPPVLKLSEPLPANLFVELGRVMNPAVVNISTTVIPKRPRFQDPMMDLFQQLYGGQMMPAQVMPQHALGTGFIIREDGLILTNNHVIDGADEVKVQLAENSKKLYDAKVIGRDSRTDIALIKIKPDSKLTVAQLGSSKDLQPGEWVAAFGNPYGHGHTMTKGIVSATGRSLDEINKFPLIQTDASINPGNSGGPLVNTQGLVIGVNSAIDARAQGIGFAIPIDEVKSILAELEQNGKIKSGYIGVMIADLTPDAAAYLGIENAEGGVVITNVEKGGPAQRGGLQPYDVVVEANGKTIHNSNEFVKAVADAKIGSKVSIKALRGSKSVKLELEIAEMRDDKNRRFEKAEPPRMSENKAPFDVGVSIAQLTPELRKEFNVDPSVSNRVIITQVKQGSAAQAGGLHPGDIILDVNKVEVRSVSEVVRALHQGTNTFRIVRGDYVTIVVVNGK